MSSYTKPAHWAEPKNKLFPYQVGFTCPPYDWCAGPTDFQNMAPDSVGVHGRMLHVPDYTHRLDQRRQNFNLLEEFVECMANNGADVCGQVGSNWVHASGLGVEGVREHCEMLSEKYDTPFHMAGYAMVEALRDQNIEKVALNAAYHHRDWWQGTASFLKEAGFDVIWAGNFHDQGWFATRLAQANLRRVTMVDANDSHVADARLMAEVLGYTELEFLHSDIFELDTTDLGQFDLVLMLGLLYHLENPVGALRLARALCRRLCVVETQIIPGMTGMVDFGSFQFIKPLHGSFGLIDESDEAHGPEAGVSGVCLVPSLEALTWLLQKVGFSRVEVLKPPPQAYEQLRYGKRVMVAAYV